MTSSATNPTPPKPDRKPLQTFALHAVFLSLLFSVLPSLDAVYGYGFKSAGDAVFGRFGSELRVEYRWIPPNLREASGEIEMVGFRSSLPTPLWESAYSVRDRGYQPTAVLLALILATPSSRRRQLLGCLGGAVGLNAFYLAQTGLLAGCLFASLDPGLVAFGSALALLLPVVEALFGSPLVRYAAVFTVWAIAAAPARGLDMSDASNRLSALLDSRKPG